MNSLSYDLPWEAIREKAKRVAYMSNAKIVNENDRLPDKDMDGFASIIHTMVQGHYPNGWKNWINEHQENLQSNGMASMSETYMGIMSMLRNPTLPLLQDEQPSPHDDFTIEQRNILACEGLWNDFHFSEALLLIQQGTIQHPQAYAKKLCDHQGHLDVLGIASAFQEQVIRNKEQGMDTFSWSTWLDQQQWSRIHLTQGLIEWMIGIESKIQPYAKTPLKSMANVLHEQPSVYARSIRSIEERFQYNNALNADQHAYALTLYPQREYTSHSLWKRFSNWRGLKWFNDDTVNISIADKKESEWLVFLLMDGQLASLKSRYDCDQERIAEWNLRTLELHLQSNHPTPIDFSTRPDWPEHLKRVPAIVRSYTNTYLLYALQTLILHTNSTFQEKHAARYDKILEQLKGLNIAYRQIDKETEEDFDILQDKLELSFVRCAVVKTIWEYAFHPEGKSKINFFGNILYHVYPSARICKNAHDVFTKTMDRLFQYDEHYQKIQEFAHPMIEQMETPHLDLVLKLYTSEEQVFGMDDQLSLD